MVFMFVCRACKAYVVTMVRENLYERRSRGANLQQPVQEGDIVCPFLQRSFEECERSINPRGVFAITLVFRRCFFCDVS